MSHEPNMMLQRFRNLARLAIVAGCCGCTPAQPESNMPQSQEAQPTVTPPKVTPPTLAPPTVSQSEESQSEESPLKDTQLEKTKPEETQSAKPQPANGIDLKLFCQHWFHSPEEQKSATHQIYRAEGVPLPPSRFRMQYKFHPDGKCDWYYLSPDDNHRFKQGTWKVDPSEKQVIEITKDDVKERLKITELTKDTLRMTLLNPPAE